MGGAIAAVYGGADFFQVRPRFRDHLRPFGIVLGGVAGLLLLSLIAGEPMVTGNFPTARLLFAADAASARVLMSSIVTTSTVLLALLGTLSLTMVFLTSSRFSPTMTTLFLGDPGIVRTLAYATGVLMAAILTLFSIRESEDLDDESGHVPRGLMMVLMVATCSVAALVLPYCTYVLEFFNPRAIGWRATERVRRVFRGVADAGTKGGLPPLSSDAGGIGRETSGIVTTSQFATGSSYDTAGHAGGGGAGGSGLGARVNAPPPLAGVVAGSYRSPSGNVPPIGRSSGPMASMSSVGS
jgi:hypothetical protein